MTHGSWAVRRAGVATVAALLGASSTVYARTIAVPAGANLQQALNVAAPGDVVTLDNGAVYTGNFVLPDRGNATAAIIIRPARVDGLPGPGQRVGPDHGPRLPRLHSPNGAPALRTAAGARGWRVELVEFTARAGGPGEIVALGDGSSAQRQIAQVPRDLVFDRCYVHGTPDAAQKRCIALNSAETTITGSYVAECKAVGQDSQAIAGWNGPGPFTISNNYLQAAGENILFGGGDPAIPDLVPSDIVISGNLIEKPLTWRGSRWSVKNLVEVKNGRRVRIVDNVIRHNWQAAQTGYAILLTVRNQDGGCPWCQVEEVTVERNRISGVAGAISILGHDDQHPSRQTRAVVIRHNLITDLDPRRWGGRGYFMLLLGAPRDITVRHNTIIQSNAAGLLQVEGPPVLGFDFTANVARHGEYGIIGTNRGPGADTIRAYFPESRIKGNLIAGADAGRYPDGNTYPAASEFDGQFVDAANGDYRLTSRLRVRMEKTDPPGADMTKVPAP